MNETLPTGRYSGAERVGRLIETIMLCIAMAVMIGLAALQIIMRNGFGVGIGWADEVLRILVLWIGMLGAVVASRAHRHLAVDVLSHYLSAPARRIALISVDACTAVVCFALSWTSAALVFLSVQSGEKLVEVVPAWIVQTILPVGFLMIAYRYSIWTIRHVRGNAVHANETTRLEVPR